MPGDQGAAAPGGWWGGLGAGLVNAMGGLAKLRILIPVALLVFGLPKLWEN
jgi:hypothetical protein